MSLERIRRQHNLTTKPSMTLIGARTDRNGKRYTFRLNESAIFYAISAADFWAGPTPAPQPAPEPTPEPERVPRRPQIRVPRGAPQPLDLTLARADALQPGDVIARKASPAGRMTVHDVEPAGTHGRTRITYTGARGRTTTEAFSGEKFILHKRAS